MEVIDAGPIGERVGDTVRRLRRDRGWNLQHLAEAMAASGRPIADRTLLNVERGLRRVDVDDLVTLALALNVSPARLLMPLEEPTEDDHNRRPGHDDEPNPAWLDLTPKVRVDWSSAWSWVTGERPLDGDGDAAWHRLNRPHAARPVDRDALSEQARTVRQLIQQLQVSAVELERAAAREPNQHPVEVLDQIHDRRTKETPRG